MTEQRNLAQDHEATNGGVSIINTVIIVLTKSKPPESPYMIL